MRMRDGGPSPTGFLNALRDGPTETQRLLRLSFLNEFFFGLGYEEEIKGI